MRKLQRWYERPLEPPEPDNTGIWVCEDCGKTIPGDSVACDFDGTYYCEDCLRSHFKFAPYKEDYDPRGDERDN